MGVKVLLVDTAEGLSKEGLAVKPLHPFLGLAYIGAFLRQECAAEVKIVDMAASRLTIPSLELMIGSYQPDIVGITAKTFNVLAVFKVAMSAKRASPAVTLLGGAHATALPERTLEECPEVDATVIGEGELTVREIAERFAHGLRPPELFSEVAGVAYRTGSGAVERNLPRELITDLDSLPFPDYSLYDLKAYGKSYNPQTHCFDTVFPVFTSRGCPYKCTFCMPLLTRRVRYRSVANVIDEIRELHKKYGARRIYFEDSTFCINRPWFDEFCRQFVAARLPKQVTWGFETRVDLAQDAGIFEKAKAAGCTYVFFGIESASDDVLQGNKKGITKDQATRAVRLAQNAGIDQIAGSFIFGLPYETRATLEETLSLIHELKLDVVNQNIVSIYPGTELWDMVERGDGGIRWIPGMRYNWATYSRATCQTIVSDLGVHDLLEALKQAQREELASMRRRSTISFLLKLQAYLRYYLCNDPGQLIRYAKQYARFVP